MQICAKPATNANDSRLYNETQSVSSSVSRSEYMQLLDYYREPQDLTGPFASNKPPPTPSVYVHVGQRKEHGDSLSSSSKESGEVLGLGSLKPKPSEPNTTRDDRSESEMCLGNTPGSTSFQDYRHNLVETNPSEFDRTSDYPRLHEADKARAIDRFLHLLEDRTSSHGQIYEAYCQIPSPGVVYIAIDSRRLLFHRLSIIENRSKQAMLRYLRLVDDMKDASIPLSLSEWNTAIAYAGRCFVHVDALQVESALRIWKEMEQEAGIQSGQATFNILFDIAAKAGKYVLAEMILKEMNDRRLQYSRFSYVGFIYFHGLKGDGAGVRKAYRDLVEAGQIVDTVVMNCVIASLIRAGELPAAEQVYERMKRLFRVKTGGFVPHRDWRYSRDLGRILDRASRELRRQPKKLQQLQSEQYLSPDVRTFSILIDYHVHFTGELRRITCLLAEMQDFHIPIQGRMFIKIFRGFARHGGVKYTSWTTQRLEAVWSSLLGAVDAQDGGIQVLKWMVVWVVRAFARCCGRARALQIWEEIRDRWKVVEVDEKGAVEHLLREILHGLKTDNDC
ncbi:MAG: hypothetical protein LQ339_003955 [Xanthoria mediterranea]|nr:MAG: hypothetical protein LQ339_003955 [Xanthoria mediterranea]